MEKNLRSSHQAVEKLIDEVIALQAQGKVDQAKRIYEEILKSNPNQSSAMHNLGLLYFSEGNFSAAKQKIVKSIQLAPDRAIYYRNFSSVLASRG